MLSVWTKKNLSFHICLPPSTVPHLNIPPLGHSYGTLQRWSDKQQNKGSERESERERHLIEERKGFFFAGGSFYSSCVSFSLCWASQWEQNIPDRGRKSQVDDFFPCFIFHFPLFNYLLNSSAEETPLSDFHLTDSSLNISSLKIWQYLSLWRFHFCSGIMTKQWMFKDF